MDLRTPEPPCVALPDTQSQRDPRGIAVFRAGIRGLRLPAAITDVDGCRQRTVCTFDLGVRVPPGQRGTHMSRLVECGHALAENLELGRLKPALQQVLGTLEATAGSLAVGFPWFLDKTAPASGRPSLLDVEAAYTIGLEGRRRSAKVEMCLRVPVTTLCPCSKAISRYGAHNQRSIVSVTLNAAAPAAIARVAELIERQASCAVYAVLKREDERHVTETAYENPKFAEDLVRDLQAAIVAELRPAEFLIETENHESIHNHAAYAVIRSSARRR